VSISPTDSSSVIHKSFHSSITLATSTSSCAPLIQTGCARNQMDNFIGEAFSNARGTGYTLIILIE
jgi:hypothetical protein